jgi:two-component sensor histidine kinase
MAYADWLQRVRSGSAGAFTFAAFLVGVATLVRLMLGFLGGDVFVFAAYYPAVLFATYVGGAFVGGFAVLLSAAIAWWAFIPSPVTPGLETKLMAYLFASALVVWGADHYRRLRRRLEDEEKFRKLAVEELAHRLKNKIATIQSIISFQLRDNPKVRDAIAGRLIALSATDDLILATQGHGARVRDIISAELGPYDVSRISMAGPDILLPPKLALTLALLTHELATNAAKYGALSCKTGQLSICWLLADERLSIEWRECDGPPVAIPLRRGFGMLLLSRALDQFGGAVETTFEPTGLICKLSVALTETTQVSRPHETHETRRVINAKRC